MALVTANQFGGLVPDLGTAALGGFQQGSKVRGQFQAGKAAQVKSGQEGQLQQMQFLNSAAKNLRGLPIEQRPAALDRLRSRFEQLGIPASELQGFEPSDSNLDSVLASTGAFGEQASALDQAKIAQLQTPKVASKTSLEKNLEASGLVPGTPEFQQAVAKNLSKPSTQVNIGGEAGSFSKALGTQNAKTFGTVNEQRDTAIEANQSLSVLENIDVNTGALEPAKQAIASFGKAFGIDTSKLANVSAGEAFNAEAQRIVLSVKASQKGPQTDKDEATIRKTVAGLGNTTEGNQFIIDSARALNNRRIERADFYDNFIQSNDGKFTDPQGKSANSAWAEFKRSTPMVSANLRTPQGLPVFFYRFEQDVRQANPDASQAEILEAWRNADKKRVK